MTAPAQLTFDTLTDARRRFLRMASTAEGGVCECCGRYGKVYRRRLNAGMARDLIAAVRATAPGETFRWSDLWHASSPNGSSGYRPSNEFSKLRFWDLIAKDEESGEWRVTPKGRRFALGQIRVPRAVRIFDNARVPTEAMDPASVDIHEALGEPFDPGELRA